LNGMLWDVFDQGARIMKRKAMTGNLQ